MSDPSSPKTSLFRYLAPLIAVPIFLLALPLLVVRALSYLSNSVLLHGLAWSRHKKWVVFVYSDSPKWKDHVEANILPALPPGAAIINRSRPWLKNSLAGKAYQHFGGQNDYCPIGIVIDRGKPARCFRFFRPFLCAKQGDESSLHAVETAFVDTAQSGR